MLLRIGQGQFLKSQHKKTCQWPYPTTADSGGVSTAAVPAKASTASRKLTETGIEEMKAKVESERKRLREEKDLAAEEKSHIQVELEKHEKELAQVWSLL